MFDGQADPEPSHGHQPHDHQPYNWPHDLQLEGILPPELSALALTTTLDFSTAEGSGYLSSSFQPSSSASQSIAMPAEASTSPGLLSGAVVCNECSTELKDRDGLR